MEQITFEEFKRVEIRIGEVLSAERILDSEKLLKLVVNFGEEERQIVSGIAPYVQPENLIGKSYPFVLNISPRTIRGHESNGMILAAMSPEGSFSLLVPQENLPPGSEVR